MCSEWDLVGASVFSWILEALVDVVRVMCLSLLRERFEGLISAICGVWCWTANLGCFLGRFCVVCRGFGFAGWGVSSLLNCCGMGLVVWFRIYMFALRGGGFTLRDSCDCVVRTKV